MSLIEAFWTFCDVLSSFSCTLLFSDSPQKQTVLSILNFVMSADARVFELSQKRIFSGIVITALYLSIDIE